MKYILEFETEVGTYHLKNAVKHLGLMPPIIVLSNGLSIEDRGEGDLCLKRPSVVEKLQREVNEIDCALHSCAGIGDWKPPYPDVDDD